MSISIQHRMEELDLSPKAVKMFINEEILVVSGKEKSAMTQLWNVHSKYDMYDMELFVVCNKIGNEYCDVI